MKKHAAEFKKHLHSKDMTSYWKLWASTYERAAVEQGNVTKHMQRPYMGHAQAKIKKTGVPGAGTADVTCTTRSGSLDCKHFLFCL